MAKPPADVLERISKLPRTAKNRPLELAHNTILAFADLADVPPAFLTALIERLDAFEADAFELFFDRIEESKVVALRSSVPLRGPKEFQNQVTAHLTERNFPFFGSPPQAHVTINYRADGRGTEAIEPIRWMVEEVLLIESVYGKATHNVLGRWTLRHRVH
jgi:2'-5' RNA ligase